VPATETGSPDARDKNATTWALVCSLGVARWVDLLIAESYTHQRKIRFHLDVATLQQQASRLGARRVVLTRMSPDVLARVDELGWETASDGMTLQLDTAEP
jgi:hypothetical protein